MLVTGPVMYSACLPGMPSRVLILYVVMSLVAWVARTMLLTSPPIFVVQTHEVLMGLLEYRGASSTQKLLSISPNFTQRTAKNTPSSPSYPVKLPPAML